MSLVSVIVPVYKVEKYLTRCLDSICRQSLKDIEILLINDASPDNCGTICDKYAAKDKRIIVIHKKTNQGLSVARNIGIARATSDYLMFVDSDDYVHEDFCKAAFECTQQHNADLVMFRRVNIGFPTLQSFAVSSLTSGSINRIEALDLIFTRSIGSTAWNKLYHKRLFQNISYPAGYWYEDAGTTYKLIWQANHIYFLDSALYYYCYRSGSIITQKNEKFLHDKLLMCLQRYQNLIAWGYQSEYLKINLIDISLNYCIKKKPDITDNQYCFCAQFLHTIKNNNIPKPFAWQKKVLLYLLNACPSLFNIICTLLFRKI
ncbi:glycosyltransferase family 2 protein [bacterium]|nr:glycosyltransferase family 2 protein [bacterium]